MRNRKLAVAALSAGIATTLAACGAGSSSHVVEGTTAPVAATSSTTAPPAGSPTTTAPVVAPPSSTASTTLNANTLNQVAAELGTLDTNLNTADSDLSNPQGDS